MAKQINPTMFQCIKAMRQSRDTVERAAAKWLGFFAWIAQVAEGTGQKFSSLESLALQPVQIVTLGIEATLQLKPGNYELRAEVRDGTRAALQFIELANVSDEAAFVVIEDNAADQTSQGSYLIRIEPCRHRAFDLVGGLSATISLMSSQLQVTGRIGGPIAAISARCRLEKCHFFWDYCTGNCDPGEQCKATAWIKFGDTVLSVSACDCV